jgi:hypothetical protein
MADVASLSGPSGPVPSGFVSTSGLQVLGAFADHDETLRAAERHLACGGPGPVMIHVDDSGSHVVFAPLERGR